VTYCARVLDPQIVYFATGPGPTGPAGPAGADGADGTGGGTSDLPNVTGYPSSQTPPPTGYSRISGYTNEGADSAPSLFTMNADGNWTGLISQADLDGGGYVTASFYLSHGPGTLLTKASDGAASSLANLAPGTDGQVLTADSTSDYGLSYSDPIPNVEPDPATLTAGQVRAWFDPTAGAPTVNFKAKDADGTVYTAQLPMTPA